MTQQQKPHYRSIFISDVHLGTSACQATYLLDFLENTTCDHLYLVGDIIDLLAMRRKVHFPPSHEKIIACIMRKAKLGAEVTYIPGNHDALFRRFVGQSIAGIKVRRNAVYQSLDGHRYLVSHGDEFDAVMQCSPWLNWIGDISHGTLLKLNTMINLVRKLMNLPYWSLARSVKQRIGSAKAYIQQFERISTTRASELNYDGYICGHIHHWEMRYYDGALYINDGDWVEHCSSLVETSSGEMQLMHWSDHQKVLARRSELQTDRGIRTGTIRPAAA